jgi:hypothetical protein
VIVTDAIDPWIIDRIRQAVDPSQHSEEITDTRLVMDELKSSAPAQHQAVLDFVGFKRCDISAAAKGIIWLQGRLDG